MRSIQTINPADNSRIDSYDLLSDEGIEKKLQFAQTTWQSWRKTTFEERAHLLQAVAKELEKNKYIYARTMTLEMGKVYKSAVAEVEKCAWVCRYYAEKAATFLMDELVATDASKSYISYQPLGAILAVMPWNYPFWQVFRFAAPCIMAGNVAILKHASNVPKCALQIEEIFTKAGAEKGLFQTLLIESKRVEPIIADSRIKAVTLTGSTPAGRAVAAAAGKYLKKSVLELGGSDPSIILADADLELAAQQCTISRLLNAGQSCIGAKRFIVVETVYEEFLALFKSKMQAYTLGNPLEEVDLGPMARIDLRDEVHEQVQKSIEAGAKLVLGGVIPDSVGAYYPPTILTNVKAGMPAYDEELFGPVAAVIKVKDKATAIAVANDTSFGLGASIYTKNKTEGERIAREELQAGCCFVNQFVKSDPRLPFGGIGESGFGRELSYYGIREFVNIKTVYIK